jgi:hypothetical protein
VRAAGLDLKKEVVRAHPASTHLYRWVDLPTVQRILGPKRLQMVVHYSHANREHVQTAMDKLEQRYKVS